MAGDSTGAAVTDHDLVKMGMRGHGACGLWVSGRHPRGHWMVSWSGESWEAWIGIDSRIVREVYPSKRMALWCVRVRISEVTR